MALNPPIKKDRAGYDQMMTAKYERAQKNFLGEFKEVYGNEKDAMLRLNKADFGVKR